MPEEHKAWAFDPRWYAWRYERPETDPHLLEEQYRREGRAQGCASSYEEESARFAARAQARASYDLTHLPELSDRIARYRAVHKEPCATVIFSAVSQGYDSLKIPRVLDPRCDYVCFVDGPTPESGVWELRPMPFWNRDATRQTRYVKFHPHHLFADYELAIWIDQNVLLYESLDEEISAFLAANCPLATFFHPTRVSCLEEATACASLHKESRAVLADQLAKYSAQGFSSSPLLNTNVVFFRLTHPDLPKLLTVCWAELEKHSKRDQIALPYALWASGASWYPLARRGIATGNHPKFGVVRHDKGRGCYPFLLRGLNCCLRDPWQGPSFWATREQDLARVRDQAVTIVLCVHNAQAKVADCLASVLAHLRPIDRLIVVDDGSEPATHNWLMQLAVGVQCHAQVLGYTRSANQALELAFAQSDCQFCILLHSDTRVTANWAEKMLLALLDHPGAGLVSVLSNAASLQSLPKIANAEEDTAINPLPPGYTEEDLNRLLEQWTVRGHAPRVPLLHGFCLGVSRACWSALRTETGLFDANAFPRGYGEEDDLSFRASDAGFDLVLATNTFVFHHKSQSYACAERLLLMQKAAATLQQRYGPERIRRACATLVHHPELVALRSAVAALQ